MKRSWKAGGRSLARLRKVLSLQGNRYSTGRRGERVACRWLKRRGYRVIARNLSIGHDEVDLLMWAPKQEALVVVEVKTRLNRGSGPGALEDRAIEQASGRKAQRQLRAAGHLVADAGKLNVPIRLDVVGVCLGPGRTSQIRHIEAAFRL